MGRPSPITALQATSPEEAPWPLTEHPCRLSTSHFLCVSRRPFVQARFLAILVVSAIAGCSEPPLRPVLRAPRAAETELTPRIPSDTPSAVPAPPTILTPALAVLPVAPRAQAKESPAEGFCGETAIQEGLLLLGVYASQSHVNRLGRPTHPDLYSHELPVALRALGVRFTVFPGGGYRAFVAFSRAALARGKPVVAGVKILPTAHPEWGLDHFVLVVGESGDGDGGLLVDTTWGTRETTSDKRTRGISLVNASYGLRLDTIDLPAGHTLAHLAITQETEREITLRASCSEPARLEQRRALGEGAPAASVDVGRDPVTVRVPRDGATYFRCVARS